MARNRIPPTVVKHGTSYTVPPGKEIIFSAQPLSAGQMPVQINGIQVATATWTQNTSDIVMHAPRPLTATAGDVISTTHANGFGIPGVMYDL